eukprot:6498377-Pyramimonas_sp.AAC.1
MRAPSGGMPPWPRAHRLRRRLHPSPFGRESPAAGYSRRWAGEHLTQLSGRRNNPPPSLESI